MSSPTRSPGPSPPSPVPFIPPTGRSPTWDEYLASSSNAPFELSFPVGFSDLNSTAATINNSTIMSEPRETRNGLTYPSGGPSPSYSSVPATQRRPPMNMTPMNQKRKASSMPPPGAFPMMSTSTPQSPPPVMTFPMSVIRSMKTVPMKTREDAPSATQVGRWTKREHELFLEGLQRFGKSWKKISSLVHTRTLVQIRTHAQKYLQKQSRAAIKADAKAAEDAAALQSKGVDPQPQRQQEQQQQFHQVERRLPQQQPRVAASRQSTLQMDAPRVPTLSTRQWKSPRGGDRGNSFVPLAFPSALSNSATKSSSTPSPRSAFQINSVSRLDQLLQDDNSSSIPVFVDEYYTSPTAIEDDLLRPLYAGEQWVPRLAHPTASTNYSNKRRRLETSGLPCTSAPTSTTVAVPALRPAFPGVAFEPLPAPDNLSPQSTSPPAYTPRQSAAAAVLLAAHETDETTNYPNAWL
ncbi:LHY protein [Phytophthora cinnamomi]|uniref:LHY protein n=1 Tax=Phytophthora cinnamomi TaxID=4785 RepID=UPI002A2F1CDE|nr:LHY protein [Phytophthora cinnamomi]KAJ8575396.1 hypothetical protein ON010_g3821 [Phytophthora cinnamomi]